MFVYRISLFWGGVFAVAVGQFDGLAGSLAEEIEFCASCLAASDRLDIDDVGRMKGEDTLDALIGDDSADGEGFADASASAGDYRTGKYLDAFFVAFSDSAAHIYGIAYLKMRYIFLQSFAFDSVEHLGFH